MLDNREIQPKPHFQDNNLSRASSHEPGISNLARGVDYRWAVIGVPVLVLHLLNERIKRIHY